MGERLVVTVRKDDTDLMKIYYHWSAYTADALYETQDILKALSESKSSEPKEMIKAVALHLLKGKTSDDTSAREPALLDAVITAVNGGTAPHGGVDRIDAEAFFRVYPELNTPEIRKRNGESHRSYGLLAFSEKGMDDLERWAEGDVTIDLDEGMVDNGVIDFDDGDIDEYNDYMVDECEEEPLDLKDIPLSPVDITYFPIGDIDKVISVVESVNAGVIRTESGQVIAFKEG